VQGSCRDPSVSSTGWLLNDLLISDLVFSPSYRRRGGGAGGRLLLRLYRERHRSGAFDDASVRTEPGEIHLFDQASGTASEWLRASWRAAAPPARPARASNPGEPPVELNSPDQAVNLVPAFRDCSRRPAVALPDPAAEPGPQAVDLIGIGEIRHAIWRSARSMRPGWQRHRPEPGS
jgi:hypothetical protein